jgi:hypothetical protein
MGIREAIDALEYRQAAHRAELATLEDALNSLEVGTDEWLEVDNKIDMVYGAILECGHCIMLIAN